MQGKYESFDKLPPEHQINAAQHSSNHHFSLFKPVIDVHKLLHCVVRGQSYAVQSILIDEISLIFQRGSVSDSSGREFENISGFEYALWALDKHMWAAMIACIPLNEKGKKVFAQLNAQYNKVNADGITYRLNGQTITEKHFDFENTIIKELQTQVDSLNGDDECDIYKQWREGVGGAQKLLPMHIINEYCSNEAFYPVPHFTSPPKPSSQFYNSVSYEYENWFSVDSKLAVDFAIYKGAEEDNGAWGDRAGCIDELRSSWIVKFDLVAMKALYKVRTNDFIDLKSQLEDQMTLDNHYQVS